MKIYQSSGNPKWRLQNPRWHCNLLVGLIIFQFKNWNLVFFCKTLFLFWKHPIPANFEYLLAGSISTWNSSVDQKNWSQLTQRQPMGFYSERLYVSIFHFNEHRWFHSRNFLEKLRLRGRFIWGSYRCVDSFSFRLVLNYWNKVEDELSDYSTKYERLES